MGKFNELLSDRLKQKPSKMAELAQRASQGNLSSFAGVFRIHPLSSEESAKLENLLLSFKNDSQDSIENDLQLLSNITSEIKAINNQAAVLHGERIKKAQDILKKYRDGAFTNWLITTYGNRQTPYNFLQYYEFYLQLPVELHQKLYEVPRQVVYTLATRRASFKEKEDFIKNYKGETKNELLSLIRKVFPLNSRDLRKENLTQQVIIYLEKIQTLFEDKRFDPDPQHYKRIKEYLETFLKNLKNFD